MHCCLHSTARRSLSLTAEMSDQRRLTDRDTQLLPTKLLQMLARRRSEPALMLNYVIITSLSVWVRSIATSVSVCLPVCLFVRSHISTRAQQVLR